MIVAAVLVAIVLASFEKLYLAGGVVVVAIILFAPALFSRARTPTD